MIKFFEMKFNKKTILKSSLLTLVIPAITSFSVISCSTTNNNYESITNNENYKKPYTSIWNSVFANWTLENKQSIYTMTIQDLENQINNEINNNKFLKKQMQILCFYNLYQSIANPYLRDGKPIPTNEQTKPQSDAINFLNNLIEPDVKNGKTFNKFNSFIESFTNIKISLINIEKNQANSNIENNLNAQLGDVLNKACSLLNFKISFNVDNAELNEKMIIPNEQKSIFTRTFIDREELKVINKYQNAPQEIKEMIEHQFSYQGSKMYYDLKTKTFESIVLTSITNFCENPLLSTTPSGFIKEADTNRKEFYFDFKEKSKSTYDVVLVINLSDSKYFNDSNISNNNWTKYLDSQKIKNEKKLNKKVEINLNKTIKVELKD